MNQRRISLMVVTALTASALAACGGAGGSQGGQAAGPEAKDNPPAASKPVNTGPREITMYTAGGTIDEKAFDSMYGDAIRKKFPDVTVKFIPNTKGSTLPDLIAAGTTIDIIFDSIGYAESFRNYGIHMDMTPFIKASGLDLNQFEQTAIEFQRKIGNGQIHSLPVWTASAGLFYNKDLFDKFGVGYPKDNMTWSEILEIAKKLTRKDGDIQYVGYVTAAGSQANTNQLGLKYVDSKTGKAQIDNEDWTKFMQSIVPFFQISGMTWTAENTTVAAMRAMFEKDRTAAMYTNYSGGTPPEDMNWDVVKVPSYEQAPGVGPQSYPAYLSMTTLSKNKELAFDVIHYLVSKEYQLLNTKAGRATVLNDKEIIKTYGESMAKFKGKNITAMFPEKRAPIGDYTAADTAAASQFSSAFTKIILNQKDINTALREANEAANKAIEEIKQKNAK
ncbi:extracellular solute-binding protein [Paenibacillus sp. GCM10012303]|uniref:extracellular solute-binding protein n=1 Tax=Paenibacillus sp. GCM10012303 TaxID=3317340 RepID=UPI003614FBB6